jgi:hypothetical protein
VTEVIAGLVVADPLRRWRRQADWAHWLPVQQRLDQVICRVEPPLFAAAITSGAAAAVLSLRSGRWAAAAGRAMATAADVAAVRVACAVNDPVEHELRSWRVEEEPLDWQTVRGRWEGGHEIRRVLVGAGAVATAVATRAERT